MRLRSCFGLLLVVFASPAMAQPTAPPQGLDDYVQQVMDDWHVPGLALAVVADGKLVLARGYGVRRLGQPARVDADTLFDIASNSKAFTAAALGTLVASNKLTWDTPVVDELDDFRLDSPYVTQAVTLRDLLAHHTGYCDPGAVWYTSDASDILERIRYQKPEYGFRTTFCYNNVQYLAASRFIPALTGESWNTYVAEHLFQPLRMARTVSTDAAVATASNVAAPHGMVDGEAAVIGRYWPHNMDIFASVGGIWSSANDMSHWMQALLDDGTFEGRTVLDASVVRAMETPQVVIQTGGVGDEIRTWMPGAHFHTYGLGLFVQDYHGHRLAWHAGDIDGMASAMVLVPDAKLGIVVLSNMDHADARFAIVAYLLQAMLDAPRHDLEPSLLADAKQARAQNDAIEKKLADTRKPGAGPPLPLDTYVGDYQDKFDGTARVTKENGHLVVRLGNPDFTGELQPWHGNTFRVQWRHRFYGDVYATFDVDALGQPARITFAGLPLHFERSGSAETSSADPR